MQPRKIWRRGRLAPQNHEEEMEQMHGEAEFGGEDEVHAHEHQRHYRNLICTQVPLYAALSVRLNGSSILNRQDGF